MYINPKLFIPSFFLLILTIWFSQAVKSVFYISHWYEFIDYTCKWYAMIFVFLCLSSLTWGDGFLVHHAADSTPVSLCFTVEWCSSCRCTALSSLFFHWTFWWIPCLAYWKSATLKIKVHMAFWMVIFFGPCFPDSSVGKESAWNVGDPSSIPATGRSAGERMGYPLQYSWASFVAQLVKNLPAMQETWAWSLGWEDPRRRERLPTPVFWPRKFHGLYSP